MLIRLCAFCLLSLPLFALANATGCHRSAVGVQVQVLGSGGPELSDQRASSSYLIWQDGKAKLLIDIGSGSLLRLEQTQANINDIEALLLTHLHVDHSADLPALIKASFFSDRNQDLTLIGPDGNRLMPSTTVFVTRLFGPEGAYRYLSSYLDGSDRYQIIPQTVAPQTQKPTRVMESDALQVFAISVNHGPIPALAWQVNLGGKKLVFSGDTSHARGRLTPLAQAADLLVAHHAIPESSQGVARQLHMPPSVIGKLASDAQVKQLVLSHHMRRTLTQFDASKALIRQHYHGELHFANDLDCFQP